MNGEMVSNTPHHRLRSKGDVMSGYRLGLMVAILICFQIWAGVSDAQLTTCGSPPASGSYRLIVWAPGAQLYEQDNIAPDFVQVIRMDQGAKIKLVHAGKAGVDPVLHELCLPDTLSQEFFRKSLDDFWIDQQSRYDNLFSITNGTFFQDFAQPIPLSFGLKSENVVETYGFDPNGQYRILKLFEDFAIIQDADECSIEGTAAPDALVALKDDAGGVPDARTFIGVCSSGGDGNSEVVLIYNSSLAYQYEARAALESFGATEIMMLDGGGSTQMKCDNYSYVESDECNSSNGCRTIPQALVVLYNSHGIACDLAGFLAWAIDDDSVLLQQYGCTEKTHSSPYWISIERSLSGDPGSWSEIASIPSNTAYFLDTGLNSGTNYYYRARAQDWNGNSAYSDTQMARTGDPGYCSSSYDSVGQCSPGTSRPITSNSPFMGECVEPANDEDWFEFYAEAGDTVGFDVFPKPGSQLIAQMSIYWATGCTYPNDRAVADPNNDNPSYPEAHIPWTIPETGLYRVKIRGYDSSTGDYEFHKQCVNDIGARIQAANLDLNSGSATVDEFVHFPGDEDWYRFWGSKGRTYDFKVRNRDDQMYQVPTGYWVMKPQVAIYADADGEHLMVSSPDNEDLSWEDSWIVGWVPPANGYYYVKVRGWDDNTGYYRLEATSVVCYSLASSSSASFSAAGGTGAAIVLGSPNCAWTASTSESWVTLTGQISGQGNAAIDYQVDENMDLSARSGTIRVGTLDYTVFQDGAAPCTYSVIPYSRDNLSSDGDSASFYVSTDPNCAWSVIPDLSDNWLHFSVAAGIGNGEVFFTVDTNQSLDARSSQPTIAGFARPINQLGVSCWYDMFPLWAMFSTAGGSVPIAIDVDNPCPWTMDGDVDFDRFASVDPESGIGDGQFLLTAPRNSDAAMREGRVYLVEHGTYNVLVYQAGTGDVPINITISGTGTGSVECPYINTSWQATGIEYTLDVALDQEFIATADQGSVFVGWSGDCTTTTATCSLPLNSPVNLVATFEPESPATHNLLIQKSGDGLVDSIPDGIQCGATCSTSMWDFPSNSQVTLNSYAAPGNSILWGGDCAGTGNTCVVDMSEDRLVSVSFWQALGIFADGFESGETSAWSAKAEMFTEKP